MSRATHIAFEPGEEEDPALAVDDLVDFLTARTDPEDPTLAVNGLEEFFPDRQNDDLEAFVSQLEAVVTEALLPHADLGDLGNPVNPVNPGDGGDDLECQEEFRSEIRRAALEFQHFAETFHAFANECHHRRTN